MANSQDALSRAEFYRDPAARCGFCGRPVDGDTISIALESEAYAAHRDSLVGRPKSNGDQEVFACNDGEGCAK